MILTLSVLELEKVIKDAVIQANKQKLETMVTSIEKIKDRGGDSDRQRKRSHPKEHNGLDKIKKPHDDMG